MLYNYSVDEQGLSVTARREGNTSMFSEYEDFNSDSDDTISVERLG